MEYGCFNGLLSISDIFEYKYNVNSYEIHEYKNFGGDIQQELLVSITLKILCLLIFHITLMAFT